VETGDEVQEGDVIASGRGVHGDRLLVNKWAYNRTPPARGDIVVFSTRGLDHPTVRRNPHYIQR
ncbi:MAG: hypothetical protein GWN71_27515, partial [Gammaproteobacteria bacterium]|nr:hypothetical protein [Gammaproteobacteria bacterium]